MTTLNKKLENMNIIPKYLAEVAGIFTKLTELEQRLEILRNGILVNPAELDIFNSGRITAVDVVRFLAGQHVNSSAQEVYLFINQWDWDIDGKLSYLEFKNWLGCEFNGKKSSPELAEMLYIEIKTLKEIEDLKYCLNNTVGFQIFEVFEGIQSDSMTISTIQIQNLLSGSAPSPPEAIRKVFKRINRNNDNTISFFEFADFFLCNRAYLYLGSCYPNREATPLSMNYSVHKSCSEQIEERSEIFSRTYEKFVKSELEETENCKLFEFYSEMETLKRNLVLKQDFSIKNLFKFFAGKKKKVNEDKFIQGLARMEIQGKDREARMIFERFDRNFDGGLCEEDFFEIFSPSSEDYRMILRNRSNQHLKVSEETLMAVASLTELILLKMTLDNGSGR